jgi:hypothetical protein
MSSQPEWVDEDEDYLRDLSRISQELAQKFHAYYTFYKKQQARIRIPIITLSSISGLLSFGTTVFPLNAQPFVSIGVGISGMLVALVGSIESFLKIQEIVTGSLAASLNFTKLTEQITVELALPRERRNSPGLVYVRECYGAYEKYWESAPSVFRRIRFVRPALRGPGRTADAGGMTTPPNSPTLDEVTPHSMFDDGPQWSPSVEQPLSPRGVDAVDLV